MFRVKLGSSFSSSLALAQLDDASFTIASSSPVKLLQRLILGSCLAGLVAGQTMGISPENNILICAMHLKRFLSDAPRLCDDFDGISRSVLEWILEIVLAEGSKAAAVVWNSLEIYLEKTESVQ